MPTDPYVATELDDSPRHKQNLPAGVAVPPPAAWVRHRPGEVGPNEPTGALFGRPGPNIGYALTLVERQQGTWKLGPHEHLEDAGAVVSEIAMKRAAGLGRAPVKHDVDLAVALLGYDSADESWQPARARLVHDAGHNYAARRRIVDAVPDDLLRSTVSEARDRAVAWRAAMREASIHE
jgi:hypothetical protein